jgi:hypothetical protein
MAELKLMEDGSYVLVDEWFPADVMSVRADLSIDQCEDVLEAVADNHDANIGINWEVIQYWAEELFPEEDEEE